MLATTYKVKMFQIIEQDSKNRLAHLTELYEGGTLRQCNLENLSLISARNNKAIRD